LRSSAERRIVLLRRQIDYHHSKSLLLLGVAIGAFMLLAKSAFQAAALNRMRKEVEIVNKLGLHARPAAQFVRCVIRFKSTITICKGEENFSADSIIEVLSANLNRGDRVILEAIGPDEQEALSELEALLLRFRDEESEAQGN
jgi:phosphocarrier protein